MRVRFQSLPAYDRRIVLARDENARFANLGAYDSGSVDVIHIRHGDVHYNQIGKQQFCLFQRLQGINSLTACYPTIAGTYKSDRLQTDWPFRGIFLLAFVPLKLLSKVRLSIHKSSSGRSSEL